MTLLEETLEKLKNYNKISSNSFIERIKDPQLRTLAEIVDKSGYLIAEDIEKYTEEDIKTFSQVLVGISMSVVLFKTERNNLDAVKEVLKKEIKALKETIKEEVGEA